MLKKNLIEKILFAFIVLVMIAVVTFMINDIRNAYAEPETVKIELVFEDYVDPNSTQQIIDNILPQAQILENKKNSSTIIVRTRNKKRLIDRLLGTDSVRRFNFHE